MIKAVFDTNVLVSSLIREGKPRKLWERAIGGDLQLVLSDSLLEEFLAVIARPHIANYADIQTRKRFTRLLIQISKFVEIQHLPQITEDPDDNIVIETALAGKAKYIVSGDRHLLVLNRFRGIRIVSIEEMLMLI
jgi:putative PIN family toxin of toxin-antitoxin system